MSDHWVGGDEFPRWYDDDLPAPDDPDPRPEADVEWSSEQTHAGEFGYDPMTGELRD